MIEVKFPRHFSSASCHRTAITVAAIAAGIVTVLAGCETNMDVSPASPATNGIRSVADAESAVKYATGKFCPSILCGVEGYQISGIQLDADGRTLTMIRDDGSKGDSVAIASLNPDAGHILGQGVVHFTGDFAPNLVTTESEAQRLVVALRAIKRGEESGEIVPPSAAAQQQRKARNEAFAAVAKAYRDAAVKPVPGEDVRRFEVQAIDAVKQKRFADAANLYGQALAIAPWWPAGHHDHALILAELGQFHDAITEMQDYLALVPNARDARAMQDQIYVWQGREAAGETRGGVTTSTPAAAGPVPQPSAVSAGGSLFQAITGGGK